MDERKNELLFDIGIFKGIMSNATDEDVKRALDTAIDIFAHLIQGYELKMPEPPQVEEDLDGKLPLDKDLEVTQED